MTRKHIAFFIAVLAALVCSAAARAGDLESSAVLEATASSGPMRQLTPPSRRSPLIISEIMYHPFEETDDRDLEFVELFNTEPTDWDIGGFLLEGEIDYTFPTGTILPGRSFAVVAAEPAAMKIQYGLTDVYGPWQGKLNNGGGMLRLVNNRGGVLLEIEYDDA